MVHAEVVTNFVGNGVRIAGVNKRLGSTNIADRNNEDYSKRAQRTGNSRNTNSADGWGVVVNHIEVGKAHAGKLAEKCGVGILKNI